jgi:hypothetical protein
MDANVTQAEESVARTATCLSSSSTPRANGIHGVTAVTSAVGSSTTEEDCRPPAFKANFSDRFLHSDEELDECYESTDDEDDIFENGCCNAVEDEDFEGDEEFRQKASVFQRQQEKSPLLSDDSQQQCQRRDSRNQLNNNDNNNNNSSPRQHTQNRQPRWARRPLYRSVSVDDLMEYQREFSLFASAGSLERANSAHSLTDFQREFLVIGTPRYCTPHQEQQGIIINNNNSKELAPNNAISLALAVDRRRFLRNSISNSDLADFKRLFCHQARVNNGVPNEPGVVKNDRRMHSTATTTTTTSVDNKNKHGDNKTDYQWGTRSLRRAVLGSDLGTFERSVRTALLDTIPREKNLSVSLVEKINKQNENEHDNGEHRKIRPSDDLAVSLRETIELPSVSRSFHDRDDDQQDDWGTRSLRKSLKEVGLNGGQNSDTATPTLAPRRMPSIDELVFLLDTPLGLSSPWDDASKAHAPSSNGLKMPRRVPSESQSEDDDDNTSPFTANIKSRSNSVNDINLLSDLSDAESQPEFVWQMRSRFRRSISSSDIEKYQRHLTTAMDEDSERMPSTNGTQDFGLGELSHQTVAVVASVPVTAASDTMMTIQSENAVHPLLAPTHWSSCDARNSVCKSSANDDTPKKPKRDPRVSRRHHRHRRSTSDEPELHMENVVISDVAPRKPTRTTTRPISPPLPRPAVVRFADDNNNQVVEIPKVSEDMKPFLFYTKRDVKRFRMNEHRRQEEQIRSYMEYLNQKENALDGTPSLYD